MSTPSWQRLPPAGPRPAANFRRWGTFLGAGLIALGLIVLSVAGGDVLRRATRGAHRLTLPGSKTLRLSPGVYFGVPAGPLPGGRAPLMNVTIQESVTGLPVPVLVSPEGAGPEPRSLFQCEVLDAGDFLITGVLADETATKIDLILMHESLASNRSDLLVGLVAFLLLCGGGSYIIWAVRRKTGPTTGTFSGPAR
ncbi:MAG: hypothetical protein IPP68_01500 [Elusimicrobia bacterium]|nr:hypothetical protein [Elusimicrobiota bacterium]